MLILLPPSETKGFGTNVQKLSLSKLSFPELTKTRSETIQSLIRLCKAPKSATKVLGVSQRQIHEIQSNQVIAESKTATAIEIYSGVLFDAFDYQTLTKSQKNRADKSVIITSALFGLLRLKDSIPHYRLSGDAILPKIGSVAKRWNEPTEVAITKLNPELIVDMRSGVYAKFWQPSDACLDKTVVIKIMTRVGKGKNAKKIAISHNNKLTKGLLVRDLVKLPKAPKDALGLLKTLQSLKWDCELENSAKKSQIIEIFI